MLSRPCLGSVYVDCDKLDLAADCYKNALTLKHTRAHQGLARVYHLKSHRKAAYNEMTKLIEKAQSNASAFEKRSEYCDREMAQRDLVMATQLDRPCSLFSSSHPGNDVEVMAPAVDGTLNVLKACVEANVKRVVYISSAAALMMNPNWSKDRVIDESCWSDLEFCKRTEQHTVNASTLALVKLLKEGFGSRENQMRLIVDVRDVAQALLLVYEKPEAEGRYICTAHKAKEKDVVEKLKSLFPNYNYSKRFLLLLMKNTKTPKRFFWLKFVCYHE
ncbi:NAD(P)-binding domain protein [Raphanus sativus]|nr:NAD(P)-binding domain protein [Raphanus sativus]